MYVSSLLLIWSTWLYVYSSCHLIVGVFARKMPSTTEFATTVLNKCVLTKLCVWQSCVCVQKLCVQELCVFVWDIAVCVTELGVQELCVEELCVKELCATKLCVWQSRVCVCQSCVCKRCVWQNCVCVWQSCVKELCKISTTLSTSKCWTRCHENRPVEKNRTCDDVMLWNLTQHTRWPRLKITTRTPIAYFLCQKHWKGKWNLNVVDLHVLKRVPKIFKPPDCFWTVLKQNARENAVPELVFFWK